MYEHGVAAATRVDHLETEIQRKDWACTSRLAVRPPVCATSAGAFIGAVGVAQDLTETRLAQATLAEVEARLRGGEALVHVGRWLWDVGTDAVQWSDELHRIHGVDPLDFEGTLDAHVDWCTPTIATACVQSMEEAVAIRSTRSRTSTGSCARDGSDAADLPASRADPQLGRATSSGCGVSSQDITVDAVLRR